LGKSKEIAVTVSPIRKLRKPVTLQEIKSDSKLKNLPLVRISRLSVMPVTKEEWDEILRLSEK